ncbi:MAG: tRNA lysidine(34) synthetase TilS [Succinivibrio sp.]
MDPKKASDILEEEAHRLIDATTSRKLVVGLSGGADSTMVLLVACKARELSPDISVEAVHCIHGLDADDPIWFEHCTKLCRKLNVTLFTPKLNIVYGGGKSPEDVSRAERYRALLEHTSNGEVLLLGHQSDDQVENFILALKRGSGPYGLSGMQYKISDQRGTIIRPLLHYTKKEITDIIESIGFSHVFDISNTYLKFERNFVRLEVLPLLRTRFKGVDKAILRSAKLCSYEHDLALRFARGYFDKAFIKEQNCLDFSLFDVNDVPLALMVIRLFLEKYLVMPPELNAVEECLNLCLISDDQFGEVRFDGLSVRRFKSGLYAVFNFTDPEKKLYTIKKDDTLTLGSFCYEMTENAKELFTDGLVLDFTSKGSLKIKPDQRCHSRELKKLFMEYRIPVWERARHPVLRRVFDGQIVGVGSLFSATPSDIKRKINEPLLLIKNLKNF